MNQKHSGSGDNIGGNKNIYHTNKSNEKKSKKEQHNKESMKHKAKKNKLIKISGSILMTFLVGVALIHYENGLKQTKKESINSSLKTTENETLGQKLLDKIYQNNSNLIHDEKYVKFTKGKTVEVFENLDNNKAISEFESLKIGKLEPAIEYIKSEVKKAVDKEILINLLAELATLEYLNDNYSIAFEIFKTSYEIIPDPDILYQLETLDKYIQKLLHEKNFNKESQLENNTLNNNDFGVQLEQTVSNIDVDQETVILQNLDPLNRKISTHESAPVVLMIPGEIISTTQPIFGSVSFNSKLGDINKSVIIYTPELEYYNSCHSIEEEKDTFTYIVKGGLEGSVQVTVTCINIFN